MVARRHLEREQLTGLVRAAFGSARQLRTVGRLAGGSTKGVYRLTLDDGTTTVLYVWSQDENYWPDTGGADPADPFADASGAELFQASHARLDTLGVRTPRLYFLDLSRTQFPADVALVEDLRGGTLEALIARDAPAAEAPLDQLAAALRSMAQHVSPYLGKVSLVDTRRAPQDRRPEQVVLDRALRHVGIVSGRVKRIAGVRHQLEDLLRLRAAAVRPREEFALIHGELGPDHVFLDEFGQPVIIDIEGCMFFDVEWEHAFAKLRFGPHFPVIELAGLDAARMEFYRLAQSLSLIEGPLRIADGDFPGRQFMRDIAAWHTEQVLAAVR